MSRRRIPKPIGYGVPILGITGLNGAGKTLIAVQHALYEMQEGRDVYSTVPIALERDGLPTLQSKPILSLRQLLELRHATVVFDDVAVIFSSRSTGSLPPSIVALLQTLRHNDVTIIWTAPAWKRCDNLIREVTQAVVNVVPQLKKYDGTPWPRPRLVLAALLDCSAGAVDEAPTKKKKIAVYVPTQLQSFGAYDTHADTPLLGRHLQGGKCIDCGGSMETPKHSEARHEHLGIPWYVDEPARVLAVASASAAAVHPREPEPFDVDALPPLDRELLAKL